LLAAETHGLPLSQLKAQHEIGTIGLLERSAVDDLLAAQRLAETVGAMATAAVLDVEIAAGYAGMDEVDAVARHGESAVRRATELGLDLVEAYGWMHLSFAALIRGDADSGAAAAASARSAAPGDRAIDGLLIGAELLAALFADDLRLASELATRCTDTLREAGQAPPAHHRAAWPVLLALDGDAAATDAIEEIERAGLSVSRGARAWLMLARAIMAGRDDPQLAGELAQNADSLLVTMPMWCAVGRRIAAEAAARDGWSIPPGWMPAAETCARSLGFEALADSCRRLQHPAPDGRPAEWAQFGISRREADVLRLVVEGCSNREIGERLYVSVRTVEKHVESLLRKTSTRTRTQLARVATKSAPST
jgi:DNA-binding CsgD family transcriptional regulator